MYTASRTVLSTPVCAVCPLASLLVTLQVEIERDVLATLNRVKQCTEGLVAAQETPLESEGAVGKCLTQIVQVGGCGWVWVSVSVCVLFLCGDRGWVHGVSKHWV